MLITSKGLLALLLSLVPLCVSSLSILTASQKLDTRALLLERDNTTTSSSNGTSSSSSSPHVTTAPTPPDFKWLYTVFVYCPANVAPPLAGPYGVRKVIPIIGGVIEGPYFNGTLRNLGADWGIVDAQTGVFSADTRYEGVTDNGDELYFQTSGPGQIGGGLHLRIKVETSSRELYWLNEIVAVGELKNVGNMTYLNETVSILRIDAFNFTNDRNTSMFLNSTSNA